MDNWSRDAIKRFVSGRRIYLRDGKGTDPVIPTWLAEAAGSVDPRNTAERVRDIYPDDRGKLLDGWRDALNCPDEVVEYVLRAMLDGSAAYERVRVLNLLDHPDVRAVLFAARREGPVEPIAVRGDETEVDGEFFSPSWVLLTLDTSGRIVEAEGWAKEIFGQTAEEMMGQVLTEFLHPSTVADALDMWIDLMGDPGGSRTGRQRLIRADEDEFWVEATVMNRYKDDGTGSVSLLAYDIGDRRAQEQELRASREEFRLLAEEMPTPVFRSDPSGNIIFGNARWDALVASGGDAQFDHLSDVIHPDDWPSVEKGLRQFKESGPDSFVMELRGHPSAESILCLTCRSVNAASVDQRGVIGSVQDVTATAELRRNLHHDTVTGALNRIGIEAELSEALADDPATTLVAFMDLDGFKGVNDTFGHQVGDHVLRKVARRMQEAMRPSDHVARYGGDEFVLVCRAAGPDSEPVILARLESAMDHPIVWPGGSWDPAASVGFARPEPGETADSVLRRADMEMFKVKRGRNAAR